MKKTPSFWLGISLGWWMVACAGAAGTSGAGTPQSSKESGPNKRSEGEVEAASADKPDPQATASLASPVAGPALDDLPPPPPRPVEQSPIDLTTLSEPPRLVVDSLGHTGRISSLLYTHDGRSLVSASYDKTVRIWSAATGELERTIRGEIGDGPAGRLHTAALSPDDQWLALGGWLGQTSEPTHSSSSHAFDIRVLDYHSESVYRLLSGHSDVVLSSAFSHDGKKLLSGAGDRRALIWDVMGGRSISSLYGHSEGVTAVAWSPNDKLVVTGSSDDSARIWNADTGGLVAILNGHTDDVRSVTFTPSGKSILTGSLDGTVRIWAAETGKELKVLAKVGAPVGSISIAPSGLEVLVTTAGAPFTSQVYHINNGKLLSVFAGQNNVVLASAISPNGKWAATGGGGDFSVSVWGLDSGSHQIHAAGHGQTMWNVGFARDGSSIAWGANYDSKHTGQYQLNGPLLHKLPFIGSPSQALIVSALDTNQTDFVRAVTNVGSVDVRTEDGREHPVLEVSVSGSRRASIRRDLTTGFVHRAFGLTPDGKTVISGGDNGVLASYDTHSGGILKQFQGHTGDILALSISPDGKQLVTGSTDQTVRLWDVQTGALLLTVFQSRNGQWVAFTPAGYYSSSAFGDGYVGWHANRGADQPAAYFPTRALAAQLRYDHVVRQFILLGGRIELAIDACNKNRASGAPLVEYYRFEDLPQFAPPNIYYVDPGNDLRIESDRLKVTARAHSPSAEPITSIELLVNGRPLDDRWMNHVGRPQVRLSGREAEIVATLPLPNQSNRISVIAKNRFNESVPVSFEAQRKGGAKELEKLYQPDLYMLSIGISDYGSPNLEPLSYAHKDAIDLSDKLTKQNKSLYKNIDARVLTEAQASREAIMNQLNWIASRASSKDVAIIFLSGYASQASDGEYYFIPHDADTKRLNETAIHWKDFKERLERLSAKVILLVDTSHAGAMAAETKDNTVNMSAFLRTAGAEQNGIVILTSSTGMEASYESARFKHGAFTQALLEGLSGNADYDHDRFVFVRELEHYVSRRVVKLTSDKQHPTTNIPETVPNFPVSQR